MRRQIACRACGWTLLVAAAGLSGGCATTLLDVIATPSPLTIVAGQRGTVTVTAMCPSESSDPCAVPETLFDYRVVDLPDGASYTVDTSLRTPSTPTLVRIAFEIPAAAAAAGDVEHLVRIDAMAAGRLVGSKYLTLRIASPGASTTLPAAAAIGAGDSYSMAVLADGRVAAWGANEYGQLGLGHTSDRRLPTVVPALSDIAAISGSIGHSLALTTGGTVWAWGNNEHGQLGLGTIGGEGDVEAPQEVPGLTAVVAVAAGSKHSLALTSDGTVWAWGSNDTRAVGTTTFGPHPTPTPVAGLPAIRAIAAGLNQSLAAADDGSVWVWGDADLGGVFHYAAPPEQVAGLTDIQAVATNGLSAIALDRQGHVWGLGRNYFGEVGDGTASPHPVPARIAGLENVVAIAISSREGVALTGDGRIWRWGDDHTGSDRERLMARPLAFPADAAAIAAGEAHVIARLRCGQLWAWGTNIRGERGSTVLWGREPAIVPSIGDDTGCATASVRILVASDVEPERSTITSQTRLEWDGAEFVAHVPVGTSVEVTAAPRIDDDETGATTTFVGWAGDCAGTTPTTSIAVDRSQRCVARYAPTATQAHALTVLRDHGVVTSTEGGVLGPSRIECGDTCEAVFPHGTEVTLSATVPPGFAFTGWSGDCRGTATTATVVMDQPRSCRASFRAFELRVTVAGNGTVTSDPAGIDCGAACETTPRVGAVTLVAEADEGWQFTGWGGSCSGTSAQAAVTLDADRICSATFTRIPGQFRLTTIVEGDGTLTGTPAGIDCPGDCTAFYPAGSTVDLAAQPGTGAFILGWFDDCAGVGEPMRQVVLDRDLVCRVRFTGLPPYPVANFTATTVVGTALLGEIVTFDGLASHVFDPVAGTSDPAGIRTLAWDLDGDGQLDDAFGGRGSAGVVQRAYQAVGDVTVRLRVVGGPFDFADEIERTITVLPNAGTLVSLSVTKAGSGQGTIASTPQGLLECGPGCASAGPLQLLGASVTLVATADAGSTFMGWSGAGCTATTPSVTLALTTDVACTATFVPASGPFTLSVIVNGPAASFARIEALQPPGVIDCGVGGGTCTATLASGTPVILRPDTATLENNLFQGWTGCDAVGTLWTCTLSMNGPRIVFATLRP